MGILDKSKYYDIKPLLSKEALYNLIIGQRANGKSYAVKKYVTEEAYFFNRLFCLCFRNDEDKKTNTEILDYFSDLPIRKITKGEYDTVVVKTKKIYLGKTDEETGKVKQGKHIGYIAALNLEEKRKSLPYQDCYNLVFEEFITRTTYLQDEVTKLQSLASTVFRLRTTEGTCRVFLIGNTISPVNPYRLEWGLDRLDRQKIGTIDVYEKPTPYGEIIKIAVERCKNSGLQQGLAINKKGQAMELGDWEAGDYPCFDRKRLGQYNILYTFVYSYMGSSFLCRALCSKHSSKEVFIYVEKKTSDIQDNTRVIGDIMSESILYTNSFTPIVERERIIFNLLKVGKIKFSDRLTGTAFYTCYNSMTKRG